ALVEAAEAPPAVELVDVVRSRHEDFADSRQLHLLAADDRRDIANSRRHAHAFVTDPVRHGTVGETTSTGVGRKSGKDEPLGPLWQQAHQRASLRVADEEEPATYEPRDDRRPGVQAGEEKAEDEQGPDDPGDHEPLGVLERLLDLLA